MGFPGGASGKEPPTNARDRRDAGLMPGLGRSPGGGHGKPLQYSCVENPMDRGACWTIARLLCPWASPGKNTGVVCHALLQGIFPTQGLNPCLLCLLHCQAGSLPLGAPDRICPQSWENNNHLVSWQPHPGDKTAHY